MKNNINILVVDDEKTIVDVIEVYLKKGRIYCIYSK